MNDPRFDFSNFEIMHELKVNKIMFYSDEFQYGNMSNCGIKSINTNYEVIFFENTPTEWKVIIAVRQYKAGKLSGVQYFESKPVLTDVSCMVSDTFVEKYYKLCDTMVDDCVTQADKAKIGYEGTTCPGEFYVDVSEYTLVKKIGDMDSRGCVPKNFKIKKTNDVVVFSNNSEDGDGKEYTTKNVKHFLNF